jgi:hypothetical protein
VGSFDRVLLTKSTERELPNPLDFTSQFMGRWWAMHIPTSRRFKFGALITNAEHKWQFAPTTTKIEVSNNEILDISI